MELVLLRQETLVHVCIVHVPDQVYDCVCGPCVSNSVLNRTLASHNAAAQCACQQVNGGFALL